VVEDARPGLEDPDDPAAAAQRLEDALERIATLAHRPAPVQPEPTIDRQSDSVDTTALAAGLDALIVQLRRALAPRTGE
jgi:hypothetical protein